MSDKKETKNRRGGEMSQNLRIWENNPHTDGV